MAYLQISTTSPFSFDADANRDKGKELHAQYASNAPFPSIAIDDFLAPEVLDLCLARFPQTLDAEGQAYDRAQERYKSSFNPDYMDPALRTLFYAFNARPFIRFVENLTGIDGLIPDPYFLGGGFHETRQGGHLSVHADFNHHKSMDLERRVNVLIYLNKDWKDEYGGTLELWDEGMKSCVQSITPLFNRCVVFNTTGSSWHGHPAPVAHPDEVPRRSIALYYYTSTWDDLAPSKTTQFKVRPGSEDSTDWSVRIHETLSEILPPILFRPLIRVLRRLGL